MDVPLFSSTQGGFGVVSCDPPPDDAQAPVEFHFVHRGEDGDVEGVQYVDRDTWAATVDETTPKFWDDHIVTLDLPQERGGVLLVANWTGQRFATGSYRYTSGEEDGLQLAWHDGALLASTSTDGQRRLLPGAVDASEPDVFAQESLSCFDADDGLAQRLRLAIDVEGDVTGVSYLGSTPAGDGSANTCAVDAARDDGSTEWEVAADGTQWIRWDDDDSLDGDADGPSRLSLARDGNRYTLDLQLRHSTFCGQASVLASRIVLERGQKKCVGVTF